MLVVDRTVITQLQTDQTGIDFMELSANLIRAHHLRYSSTPSILDSDTTSKGLSPISLGYSPPSYEDIFGEKNSDLPPSYSELSLLFRQRQMESNEMQSFNFGSMTATRNKETIQETVLDINEEQTRVQQRKDTENSDDHVVISVPSILDADLPSVNAAEVEDEDYFYPNCKYCIMSLGSGRKARIKCYCYQDSDNTRNECVLTSRSCEPDTSTSGIVQENENYSECSAYTAERIGATRKNGFKNDVKDDINKPYDNDVSDESYDKRTLSENSPNEEASTNQTCEDIRESSL